MKFAHAGIALLLLASIAHADDWRKSWRQLETPHFHIVYYVYPKGGERSGEELIAQKLAVVAERVHAKLVPIMGPGLSNKRKTWILLSDDTDDYNGSATVQPYPNVRLNGVTPDDRTEHNDWDDYLTDLFLHEYVHILHIGTIGGVCAELVNDLLGWGLGIVYPPNQAQPRFLIEGLAVFEESERTSGGRLRSSIWDMYLRAASLENRFETLAEFTHSPIHFPYANSAYLYGSAFMRYVARRYGELALRLDYEDYGSNCIPGAINRSLKRVTGKTWVELYPDFKQSLKDRYTAQLHAIDERGRTPTRVLTGPNDSMARPVWTPNGEILYTVSDGYSRQAIRRIDPATYKWRNELRTDGAGGPSITRDGRLLVFHAVQPWHTFYYYNDLYQYDRDTQTTTRLTHGLRAANPNISADGTKVVFEMAENMARGLGLLDLATGAVETLIPPARFEVVYTPVFSPDGKTVAFSWWREGGYRDIWTMDLQTRVLTRLTADRSIDMEPRYSPDGKYLYWVSDRTEVYNLYAYELATRKLWQVSNVVNGLFDPAISPDGKRAALVGFQADGYRLEVLDLDPAKWWTAAPAILDREDPPPVEVTTPPLKSHRYNPLPTAIPWTFGLFAQPDGYGEIIGLKVGGNDIVGHHSWDTTIGISTSRADDVRFTANYSYYGLWPSLNAGVGHSLLRKQGLIINGQDIGYDEDDWSIGASINLPIVRRLVEYSDLYFSYSVTWARNLTRLPPPDPNQLIPQLPNTGRLAGLGLGWSFSNLRRYTFSVAPESGRDVGLNLGVSSVYLGGSHESYSVSWHWNEYIGLPWHWPHDAHHVLKVGYSGGISGGDPGFHTQFYLGGYPPQNLLSSIYDFSRPGSASLRGYPYASVFGDQFHVLNFEYRFPITWIEWGYQTLPLYFRRLHGRVFADYGGAFSNGFSFSNFKLGVGAELMMEITYFWFFPAALQLGYAYGVDKGGGNQVYFLLNNPF